MEEVGVKSPLPLKIFNNAFKRLKVIPKVGNHMNFLKIYQKFFFDQKLRLRFLDTKWQHYVSISIIRKYLTKNYIITMDTKFESV